MFAFLTPSVYKRFQKKLGRDLQDDCRIIVEAWPFPGIEPLTETKDEGCISLYLFRGKQLSESESLKVVFKIDVPDFLKIEPSKNTIQTSRLHLNFTINLQNKKRPDEPGVFEFITIQFQSGPPVQLMNSLARQLKSLQK